MEAGDVCTVSSGLRLCAAGPPTRSLIIHFPSRLAAAEVTMLKNRNVADVPSIRVGYLKGLLLKSPSHYHSEAGLSLYTLYSLHLLCSFSNYY